MSDKLISLNAVIAAINEGFLTRAELRRKIMLISPVEQPMSTVEYAHHHGRLCSKAHIFCNDCPIYKADYDCVEFERDYPEEAVAIVEKWAREHPEEEEK